MRRWCGSLAAAFVIFTRIPIPLRLESADFRRAIWYLPLLGVLYAGAQGLLQQLLPWPSGSHLVLALLLALPVLLGGGLHEDGLADFCDGMLGGATRERRLEIMKDPRIGSYGALGLGGTLLLQGLALGATRPAYWVPALLLSQVLARALAVSLVARLPYVQQSSSRSLSYLPDPGYQHGLLLALIVASASLCVLPSLPLALVALTLFVGWHQLWVRGLKLSLGGYTGDCLGAAIKGSELLVLLLLSLLWPLH